MRVQDLMSKQVKTITPAAAADDAWNLMRLHRIHHLVVTDAHRIVGVVSARDASGRRGRGSGTGTVADVMTSPAVTVEPNATIRQAANVMRGRTIGCLVVVEAGRAVGIVTVSDLLELVGRGIDRGAVRTTRWTLKQRAPRVKMRRPRI